tara:strand:+ start:2596 stop:2949 length:354 start_codon:yes stop_codon:yes gene_type:complete
MDEIMHFSEYEHIAKKSALYPKNEVNGVIYTAIGLSNESGEVLGKLKKIIRDFDGSFSEGVEQNKEVLIDELGDVLWYLCLLGGEIGSSLEEIAQKNNKKLYSRLQSGTIKGDGDDR